MIKLIIITSKAKYEPAVVSGLTWDTERKSTPGKAKFQIISDPSMKFAEGDAVEIYDGTKGFFRGFIFTISTSGDGTIDITAYDQLRYFKNKDTRSYKSKTADALLKLIGNDYGLSIGSCDKTGLALSKVEDDAELFAMMEDAMYDTLIGTGKLYVLYDDFGKLRLRDCENMQVPILIGSETAGGYTLTSSIDNETYNRVKLVYTDNSSGKKSYFVAEDTKTQKKWGLLQKYETINSTTGANQIAKSMLQISDTPIKTLKFKDCFGDIRVRAGVLVMMKMNPEADANWMLVEKATHNFKDGAHFMDLTLKGGAING